MHTQWVMDIYSWIWKQWVYIPVTRAVPGHTVCHGSSTVWVIPPCTSKQLFLRNYSLQQQQWLMLLGYHSLELTENKQIVSGYTHILCKYMLKLCVVVHQRWPLWKNQLWLRCSDLSRTRQLSAVIFGLCNNKGNATVFSPTCMKAQSVSRAMYDLSLICFSVLPLLLFIDHRWQAFFRWLNHNRLGALRQSDC